MSDFKKLSTGLNVSWSKEEIEKLKACKQKRVNEKHKRGCGHMNVSHYQEDFDYIFNLIIAKEDR